MHDLQEVLFEMYKEYCRLKGYDLPTKPIEIMVDEATGAQDERMREFAEWFRAEILPRWRLA